MRSYDKLKELRDETVFEIKVALKTRRQNWDIYNKKMEEGKNPEESSSVLNLQNAIVLDHLLDELCKLYEIK